jgi:hypothetical protein
VPQAFYTWGKTPTVPIKWKVLWAPYLDWTGWKRGKSLTTSENLEVYADHSYNKSQQNALISQIYFWNRILRVWDRYSSIPKINMRN